jgi:hypothetical protein
MAAGGTAFVKAAVNKMRPRRKRPIPVRCILNS